MPCYVVINTLNCYANGAYSAKFCIGSNRQFVNLVLDTGSSSLVVNAQHFDWAADTSLSPTYLLQQLNYGIGSWFGPIVTTSVSVEDECNQVTLAGAQIALAFNLAPATFGLADGMLGLAYKELNAVHNVSATSGNDDSLHWYLEHQPDSTDGDDFRQFLLTQPKELIPPFLDCLVETHQCDDFFSLSVHRSSIYNAKNPKQTHQHPLNHGLLVIGKPDAYSHLYQGTQRRVKVTKDLYYNVEVISIEIKGRRSSSTNYPVYTQPIKLGQNAIVDSGASYLVLNQTIFHSLITQLSGYHPSFAEILADFCHFPDHEIGIPLAQVDLAQWPDIIFTLRGEDNEEIQLPVPPQAYWQTHAPKRDQISFKIACVANMPTSIVLGLPLFCHHFTTFDRKQSGTGVIGFAAKNFYPHRLSAQQHDEISDLMELFNEHHHPVPLSED